MCVFLVIAEELTHLMPLTEMTSISQGIDVIPKKKVVFCVSIKR